MSLNWTAARDQMMLDPSVINLNTGSFGPLSKPVFERVTELRRLLAAEPMDFYVRRSPDLLWDARVRLAEFLGCPAERLVFTDNVTHALNIVIASLRLAAPGEIVMTDLEYQTTHWCWARAAQRHGLTVRTFTLPHPLNDPQQIVDAAVRQLRPETRVLYFSHVISPTGLVLPAKDLCREARKRGILTVVDGAHAPAMVPLRLHDIDCDFYGGNCHKWLLAPSGTGFLYLGRSQEDRIQPLQVSWGWFYDRAKADERDEFGATGRIRSLEFTGTRDPCPWMSVPVAIDFQQQIGFDRIRDRNESLVQHVHRRFGALLEHTTPKHPQMHGFLTAFRLPPQADILGLRKHLWDRHRIELPHIDRPEGKWLRVSTHFYNTETEIDTAAQAVEDYLRRT